MLPGLQMSNPGDKIPPYGYEEDKYLNEDSLWRTMYDNQVLTVSDMINPRQYNDFVETWKSQGLSVGNLLLWHLVGDQPRYDIFPVIFYTKENENETE